MLIVKYYHDDFDTTFVEYEYPDSYEAKVLQSGVLQIRQPVEIDVPELGEDNNGNEQIVMKKSVVMAVFNGNYVCRRTHHEDL